MAASFLVEQFQGQEAGRRRRMWDHVRAGIARLSNQVIEPELGQGGKEEKDAGDAHVEASARCANELMAIGRGLGTGLRTGDPVWSLWGGRKPGW